MRGENHPFVFSMTHAQEISALFEIFELSLADQPYPVVLQRIVEQIKTATGIPIVAVEMYDQEAETMLLSAATGSEFQTDRCVPAAKTLSGSVVQTLTPLIQANPSRQGFAEMWIGGKARTLACFPMLAGKKCLGALTLAHPELAELNADLQKWAASTAIFIGSFIAGAIAIQTETEAPSEINRHLKVLRSIQDLALEAHFWEELYEFFAAIHEKLSKLIPAENLYFASYDHANHKITFQYFSDSVQKESEYREYIDQDHIRSIAESGQPVHFSDQPWLGVPVKFSETVAGALAMYSYNPDVVYGTREMELLQHVAGMIASVMDRRKMERSLRLNSTQDEMTQLPNATLFRFLLNQILSRARRNKDLLAVLILDLDHFKKFRRDKGERVASSFVKQIAGRLKRSIREGDTLARWGDDQFIWAISSLQKIEDVALIAAKMLTVVSHPVYVEGHEHTLTTSIGISLFPYDGGDPESLVSDAENALIRAKEMGRNKYQFYTEDLNARIAEQLMMRRQLRNALQQHDFIPYYQPVVDLKNGKILSVEALVRWNNADGKLVTPDEFLSIVEDSALMEPLDQSVLRSVCEAAAGWAASGPSSPRVSVNLSKGIFQRLDFVELVSSILKETRLAADCLELEISEQTLRDNLENSMHILPALRAIGVHLCVDNFGSGGLPVAFLKYIHSIKIAAGLIQAAKRTGDYTSLFPIVSLAHSLSIPVIAKGIESAEELEFVRIQHCDGYQGNFFSPPIASEAFEKLWRKQPEEKVTPKPAEKPWTMPEPPEPERLPWPVTAALDWSQATVPVELTVGLPEPMIRPEPPVPDVSNPEVMSRGKVYSFPGKPQRAKFPEAQDYFIVCYNCEERFDALVAPWCCCLVSDGTLTCLHCNACFCKASLEYKLDFWTNSPQGMWDRRIAEEKEQEDLQSNPKPEDVARPLVLVVDDERQVLKVAVRAIKELGYGVVFAGNGSEGLEMAKEYLPEMVLSDALMPKMDGREMCRILKQDARFRKTKVVIMTSLSVRSKDKLAAFREFQMDDYVQKPLELRALRQLLEKYLR